MRKPVETKTSMATPHGRRKAWAARTLIPVATLFLAANPPAFPADLPSTTISAIDSATPPTLAPGAPAGNYSLSGFEDINVYNGHLSLETVTQFDNRLDPHPQRDRGLYL